MTGHLLNSTTGPKIPEVDSQVLSLRKTSDVICSKKKNDPYLHWPDNDRPGSLPERISHLDDQ